MKDPLTDIESNLWSAGISPDKYPNTTFQNHLLEQYKLYVEMADRISQRRGTANTFFLTINTAIIGALGTFIKDVPRPAFLAFVFAAIVLCSVWIGLIQSYRNLNSAKFKVIGALERKLPASPYWLAEWTALGQGEKKKLYIPLTALEPYVPLAFIAAYLLLIFCL
jgi:hypothetical protein